MSIAQQLLPTYTLGPILTSTASGITAARQAYSQTNVGSGGTAGYTYSISSGTVPAGTSINAATGTVSGTPTTAGAFSYNVMVTDAAGKTATNTVSGTISAVVGGSSTFTSGSGNFTVPPFNTLIIQLWGGGGGGGTADTTSGLEFVGAAGTASTSGTLGLTAGAGAGAPQAQTGVAAGGTASGGNAANTPGGNGGAGGAPFASTKGNGGSSPNGGAAVASPTLAQRSGIAGNAPGGGGSGSAEIIGSSVTETSPGGAGGAYCQSNYSAGAISVGSLISFSVGPGGAGGSDNFVGGAGAHGQVTFTWS